MPIRMIGKRKQEAGRGAATRMVVGKVHGWTNDFNNFLRAECEEGRPHISY
jgi:hypothetical protein